MSSLYLMMFVVVAGILAAGVVALAARARGAGTSRPQPHVPVAAQQPPVAKPTPSATERDESLVRTPRRRAA